MLSEAELAEFTRRYWHTEDSWPDLEAAFGVRPQELPKLLPPIETGELCPRCAMGVLVWTSRPKRTKNEGYCRECRHRTTAACRCAHCRAIAQAEADHRAALEEAEHLQATDEWLRQYGSLEHARWALQQLSVPQLMYLDALRETWRTPGRFTWEGIAKLAGTKPHLALNYCARLRMLRLIFDPGKRDGWRLHPELDGDYPIVTVPR